MNFAALVDNIYDSKPERHSSLSMRNLSLLKKDLLQLFLVKRREKAFNTWYSQAVAQPSTNQAWPCLHQTSWRVSRWYGCKQQTGTRTGLLNRLQHRISDFLLQQFCGFISNVCQCTWSTILSKRCRGWLRPESLTRQLPTKKKKKMACFGSRLHNTVLRKTS